MAEPKVHTHIDDGLPDDHPMAGADRRSHRTERRRAEKDREFLAVLRIANLEQLLVMWRNHNRKGTPKWKIVALQRAIAREQRVSERQ